MKRTILEQMWERLAPGGCVFLHLPALKFFRGTHPGTPGAGLGLAICKGIIDAHGGTLRAGASARGGARFTFTLPRVGVAPQVPHEVESAT